MKTVKLKLESGSINKLINKLQNFQQEVEICKKEAVKEALDISYEWIVNMTAYDTGETALSTTYDITDEKATITQRGDHVFETEFGDGVYFGDYPDTTLVPTDIPTHKGDYWFTPYNPNSKYYHLDKNGRPMRIHAYGQEAGCQMYTGAMLLRDNIPQKFKEKVSGALSKI